MPMTARCGAAALCRGATTVRQLPHTRRLALFPYLSQVARRYLAMPAASASVERLFSVAGQVVTTKRNSLHPSTVTLLVFLHEAILDDPGVIEREALVIIQDKILVE